MHAPTLCYVTNANTSNNKLFERPLLILLLFAHARNDAQLQRAPDAFIRGHSGFTQCFALASIMPKRRRDDDSEEEEEEEEEEAVETPDESEDEKPVKRKPRAKPKVCSTCIRPDNSPLIHVCSC